VIRTTRHRRTLHEVSTRLQNTTDTSDYTLYIYTYTYAHTLPVGHVQRPNGRRSFVGDYFAFVYSLSARKRSKVVAYEHCTRRKPHAVRLGGTYYGKYTLRDGRRRIVRRATEYVGDRPPEDVNSVTDEKVKDSRDNVSASLSLSIYLNSAGSARFYYYTAYP